MAENLSPPELTDDEREFLTAWERGLAGALGQQPTAVAEAHGAARAAVDAMTERWPSRTMRLAVLAALAAECKAARDSLLDEVLLSRYQWAENKHSGELMALAWQTYEERGLSAISGLSPTTIRQRIKDAAKRSYEAAKADADKAAAERKELGQ